MKKQTILYLIVIIILIAINMYAKSEEDSNELAVLFNSKDRKDYSVYFPRTNDRLLQKTINDPDLFFYFNETMPKCYQSDSGINGGIELVSTDRGVNPNLFRPWRKTFGLDECPNSGVLHFAIIKEPIRWWRNDDNTYEWKYANGTVFGEILTVKNLNDGTYWPFEVRLLIKSSKRWFPNIYRPFEQWDDLNRTIDMLGDYAWNDDKKLYGYTISDRFNIFKSDANFHFLGKFPEELTKKLLTETPFRQCKLPWLKNCSSPTTEEDFGIVPKNYEGAFLDNDSKTCMSCHSTTLMSSRKLDSEWVGRVRGSDGIFSFHIFEPDSINDNGIIKLRSELINKDVLRHWNDKGERLLNFKI